MAFERIDRQTWSREPYFDHYFRQVPCTYSMDVQLDITALRQSGAQLYPALLYAIAAVVNRHPEFRTSLDGEGQVGVFSRMSPSYTLFHQDTETFSNLWTEYQEDYPAFLRAYREDVARYGGVHRLEAKPDAPDHLFCVSMLPWTTFQGFHLHLSKGDRYLLPIFTLGKYHPEQDRWLLPLAVQVHHAVCDGFHICRFVNELQQLLDRAEAFAPESGEEPELLREPGRIYARSGSGRLLAEVTFPQREGVAVINHTFVDPSLRGRGMAGRLLQAVVDTLRQEGRRAVPTCPYAARWFETHPEARDLLAQPGE